MINLLPDNTKRDISAARTNVILLRYNILTIVATSGLLLICLLFFFVLSANQSSTVSRNTENEMKAATFSSTRQEADEYKKNLSTAKAILDRSVNYTSTIFEIVKLLPPDVVLDGLSLKASDFGKQTTFTANAKSIDAATKLKQNFQNSAMFSNVHFQSVNNNDNLETASGLSYSVQVVLSVQLNKVATQ